MNTWTDVVERARRAARRRARWPGDGTAAARCGSATTARPRHHPPLSATGGDGGHQGDDRGADRARGPAARRPLRRQPAQDTDFGDRTTEALRAAPRAGRPPPPSSPNGPGTPPRSPSTRNAGGSPSSCTTPSERCCSRSAPASGGWSTSRPSTIAVTVPADDHRASRRCEAAAALRGSLRALSAPPEQVALGVALRSDCRAFEDRTGIAARLITMTELPSLTHSRITRARGRHPGGAAQRREARRRTIRRGQRVRGLRRRRGHRRPTTASACRTSARRRAAWACRAMTERLARVGGRANDHRQRRRRRHRPGLGTGVTELTRSPFDTVPAEPGRAEHQRGDVVADGHRPRTCG